MTRYWGIVLSAGIAALLVTSCSAQAQPTTPATHPATSTTPAPATTTQPSSPPVTPGVPAGAKLTAACPLLTASEVEQVLGGGKSTTQIQAREGKSSDDHGDKLFECDYGTGGANATAPFTLSVGNITESGFSASDAIDAFVKQANAKRQAVPGLGQDSAYFPLGGGQAMLALAKRSHGELRTATFEAPTVVPEDKLAQLMALVADRI